MNSKSIREIKLTFVTGLHLTYCGYGENMNNFDLFSIADGWVVIYDPEHNKSVFWKEASIDKVEVVYWGE